MKPTLKAVMLTLLATLTCGTVMAQSLRVAQGRAPVVPMRNADAVTAVFGSNLVVDPCSSCNYDSVSGGYYVWGANNCISPGTTQWIGVRFIAAASGTPRRISTSITLDPACSAGTDQVTLCALHRCLRPRTGDPARFGQGRCCGGSLRAHSSRTCAVRLRW